MSSTLAKAAGNNTKADAESRELRNQQRKLLAPFLHVQPTLLASPTAPGLLSLHPFPWSWGCRPCFCEHNLSSIQVIIKTYATDRFLMTVHLCAGALLSLLLEALL